MMWWFLKKLKEETSKIKVNPAEKDPNDRKLCKSSTAWRKEYYCPECYSITTHNECMTNICISCGVGFESGVGSGLLWFERASRQIFYNGEWKVQRSYKSKLVMAGEEK